MTMTIDHVWVREPPCRSGQWLVRCDEAPGEDCPVTLYWAGPGLLCQLWVYDADVGHAPLTHYHQGLTDVWWKFVEPNRDH